MDTSKPYLINVAALKRDHYYHTDRYFFLFAASTTYENAWESFEKLKAAFPEPAYNVTITRWECVGQGLDEKAIDSLPRP